MRILHALLLSQNRLWIKRSKQEQSLRSPQVRNWFDTPLNAMDTLIFLKKWAELCWLTPAVLVLASGQDIPTTLTAKIQSSPLLTGTLPSAMTEILTRTHLWPLLKLQRPLPLPAILLLIR